MITPKFKIHSTSPIYVQLYDFIKKEIFSGKIKAGEKLPSKRALSSHLGIAISTCTAAYENLIDEGYIVSKERSGYFVEDITLFKITEHQNMKNNKKENHKNMESDNNSEHIDKTKNNNKIKPALLADLSYKKNFIYDLSYNMVDFKNFPYGIFKKLSREMFDSENYNSLSICDKRGTFELRTSIATYLSENRGFECSAENIIIGSGMEYLFQILFELLEDNPIFGIENPGYEKWSILFKNNKIKFFNIPITDSGMSIDSLKKSDSNIACITPSHQFPTGVVMPISERLKILSWANSQKTRYIVEDDYDSEFKYYGKPIPSLKSLDEHDKVIYIGNFSKSIAPSLRVSYMLLPDSLLASYLSIPHMICPVPTFIQQILTDFISQGYFEKHLNRSRNLYRKKRILLTELFEKNLPFCEISGSQAGLHFILKTGLDIDAEKAVVEKAISCGIKISHVSSYYMLQPSCSVPDGIIIGFGGIDISVIPEAVDILTKIISEHRVKHI